MLDLLKLLNRLCYYVKFDFPTETLTGQAEDYNNNSNTTIKQYYHRMTSK